MYIIPTWYQILYIYRLGILFFSIYNNSSSNMHAVVNPIWNTRSTTQSMTGATRHVAAAVLLAGSAYALWRLYRRRRMPPADARVPVTILTGFLGSGKTTLFNHILSGAHGKKIAVIQNEFGDVGVDDKLMAPHTRYHEANEIVEVLNGCVCCSVRTDLIAVLHKLAARVEAGELSLDAIVIETTGMANPAPVAQTLIVDDDIAAFARLDGVVTLVDAAHIVAHLDEPRPSGTINESVCQVAFADRLVLNKVDLVPDESELTEVESRLRAINAFAPIVRCTHAAVAVDSVLDIAGFDLQRALARDARFLDSDRPPTKHDVGVSSHSIDQSAPRHLRRGIGAGLLDLHAVEAWLARLLEERGADLYRLKGVLAIAHAEERYVFHAVHMVMDGHFEPWNDGESRASKLVFIGRNLDPAELNASFSACLDTPASREARRAALRFGVGETVECDVGADQWAVGEIVALMYRDASMSPGLVAPYRVRLANGGRLIAVEYDEEECVRRPVGGGRKRGGVGRRRSREQGKSHHHSHSH